MLLRRLDRFPAALLPLFRLTLWLHKAGLRSLPFHLMNVSTWAMVNALRDLPDHGPDSVDGRRGWQWVVAVRGYLSWRAGRDWRPVRDRNVPASADYTAAVNALNQAWSTIGDCACVYCSTDAPFYVPVAQRQLALFPEKKSVASVRVGAKKAGAA